jgi:hypothetical protein
MTVTLFSQQLPEYLSACTPRRIHQLPRKIRRNPARGPPFPTSNRIHAYSAGGNETDYFVANPYYRAGDGKPPTPKRISAWRPFPGSGANDSHSLLDELHRAATALAADASIRGVKAFEERLETSRHWQTSGKRRHRSDAWASQSLRWVARAWNCRQVMLSVLPDIRSDRQKGFKEGQDRESGYL